VNLIGVNLGDADFTRADLTEAIQVPAFGMP
jgi:uncharacterized protein YjbI with pentapeptide repeats